jgi:hypothetical protein
MPAKKRPWLVALVVALLLGGACVGYPVAKIRWSRQAVDGFCAGVTPGSPAEGLARRAREASLQVIEVDARTAADGTTEPATLLAWEGWGFVRRFCRIEHDGVKVTNVNESSLD